MKGLLGLVSGRGNLNKRNHSHCFQLVILLKKQKNKKNQKNSRSQLLGQRLYLGCTLVFLEVTCLPGKHQHPCEGSPIENGLCYILKWRMTAGPGLVKEEKGGRRFLLLHLESSSSEMAHRAMYIPWSQVGVQLCSLKCNCLAQG